MFERPWIKKGIHPKIDAFWDWDELIERFAETASDTDDSRPPYLVASRDNADAIPRGLLLFMEAMVKRILCKGAQTQYPLEGGAE